MSDQERAAAETRTILLVEDDALIGLDLKRTLERGGYEVGGPFKSEAEARGYLDGHGVDAALLDVNLGAGGTSLGLAADLKTDGRPFAFLTGYAAQEDQFGGGFEGVVRLSKPARPNDVLRIVGDLLADA